MLASYIDRAMEHARYEIIEGDGAYWGEIPDNDLAQNHAHSLICADERRGSGARVLAEEQGS